MPKSLLLRDPLIPEALTQLVREAAVACALNEGGGARRRFRPMLCGRKARRRLL